MIQAKGIVKSFGTLKVLKGVDLSVGKSEVLSIMGASGAGKSTLLQILGTLSTPDAGSLEVDGTDVLALRGDALARFRNRRVGFVFQFHHLLPEFTALENVMIPALIGGSSNKEADAASRELLEKVGLKDRMGHKPSELSGGEQQRVAIARAIVCGARVLLCDEPTGSLDSVSSGEIIKIIKELNNNGTTVILITHDNNIAQAKRIIEIKDGRIVKDEKNC